jgi:DNA replication protein DnaC
VVDAGRERMVRLVGERYADCGFTTFEVGDDVFASKRQAAKDKALQYATTIVEQRAAGRNLILVGSVGTGKDHLASAVVRTIVGHGMSVAYTRGSVLANEMLAAIKGDPLPEKYATRDFLVVSDIEPRGDKETSVFFQTSILDLIDERYRAKLPTIITSNIETRDAMNKAIGKRTMDRLCEDAVIIKMCWNSYRGGVK